jgi:hypothetical protein
MVYLTGVFREQEMHVWVSANPEKWIEYLEIKGRRILEVAQETEIGGTAVSLLTLAMDFSIVNCRMLRCHGKPSERS